MSDSVFKRLSKRKLRILGSAILAALSVWLGATLLRDRTTPALRMSAGPEATRRHTLAEYLCKEAAENNLSVQLITTAGSEESLNQLKRGQLDVALVSNGIAVPNDADIMVLGAIQMEAIHVLVRKEMADGKSLIDAIRGKRVNLGEKGSTEWLLSQELLAFGRLKLPSANDAGDVTPTQVSKVELMEKAHSIKQATGAEKEALIRELPDCILIIATLPSTIVQQLIEAADYRLVPIPATRAFLSDNLQDTRANTTVIEREFLERTVIPASSYFATEGYPPADCEKLWERGYSS